MHKLCCQASYALHVAQRQRISSACGVLGVAKLECSGMHRTERVTSVTESVMHSLARLRHPARFTGRRKFDRDAPGACARKNSL